MCKERKRRIWWGIPGPLTRNCVGEGGLECSSDTLAIARQDEVRQGLEGPSSHVVREVAKLHARPLCVLPGQVPGCSPGMLAPGSQDIQLKAGDVLKYRIAMTQEGMYLKRAGLGY